MVRYSRMAKDPSGFLLFFKNLRACERRGKGARDEPAGGAGGADVLPDECGAAAARRGVAGRARALIECNAVGYGCYL